MLIFCVIHEHGKGYLIGKGHESQELYYFENESTCVLFCYLNSEAHAEKKKNRHLI